MTRAGDARVDTPALRVLWHHCTERWPLVTFWEASDQDNDTGLFQGVTAGLNGIVRQLRRAGHHPEMGG